MRSDRLHQRSGTSAVRHVSCRIDSRPCTFVCAGSPRCRRGTPEAMRVGNIGATGDIPPVGNLGCGPLHQGDHMSSATASPPGSGQRFACWRYALTMDMVQRRPRNTRIRTTRSERIARETELEKRSSTNEELDKRGARQTHMPNATAKRHARNAKKRRRIRRRFCLYAGRAATRGASGLGASGCCRESGEHPPGGTACHRACTRGNTSARRGHPAASPY
jgi:hypothetical protein